MDERKSFGQGWCSTHLIRSKGRTLLRVSSGKMSVFLLGSCKLFALM